MAATDWLMTNSSLNVYIGFASENMEGIGETKPAVKFIMGSVNLC